MSVEGKLIGCPYCEGTGKELNDFDPPVTECRKPMTALEPRRTLSGREILDEPCPACNGTLMIRVIK
ncbi:hypothetical protein [Bacillus mycoides]|uniref:hypothetical protein n=1 Tax=Bacillus mycoides TaxID=1405 RepID=UPI002E2045AC|nr:hypothetical protein [Bacillus mycoides]